MKVVELYVRVRYAVQIEGLSRREAARQFGIDPRTSHCDAREWLLNGLGTLRSIPFTTTMSTSRLPHLEQTSRLLELPRCRLRGTP